MPVWDDRETADIAYEYHEMAFTEKTYKLTKLLSEHGHLPSDLFLGHQGPSLNYYLELKSTTLVRGNRLFSVKLSTKGSVKNPS